MVVMPLVIVLLFKIGCVCTQPYIHTVCALFQESKNSEFMHLAVLSCHKLFVACLSRHFFHFKTKEKDEEVLLCGKWSQWNPLCPCCQKLQQCRHDKVERKTISASDINVPISLQSIHWTHDFQGESSCNLWDDHLGRAIFLATMNHTRCSVVNSILQFDGKLNRPSHLREVKLVPICSIWEMWTRCLLVLFWSWKRCVCRWSACPFQRPLHISPQHAIPVTVYGLGPESNLW